MLGRFNVFVIATVFGVASLVAPNAGAQDEEPDEEATGEEEGGTDSGTEEEDYDEEAAQEEGDAEEEAKEEEQPMTQEQEVAAQEAATADSPVELPGRTYHFVGLRYRGIIVPKFMMNLFGDGGTTVYIDAIGPEFGVRRDGFEYLFSLWWADYGMEETPFKASDDPDVAWEIVESEINVVYLTADFLWSHDFSPEFALNYGMGAGFGIVWGPLYRTQAHPAGSDDPYEYEKCDDEFRPDPVYCDDDNEHYDDYTEPSWADGGSKPVLFPWFVLQTGFRFKPHRHFAGRIDLGFGTSGFFFGVGADYGL